MSFQLIEKPLIILIVQALPKILLAVSQLNIWITYHKMEKKINYYSRAFERALGAEHLTIWRENHDTPAKGALDVNRGAISS